MAPSKKHRVAAAAAAFLTATTLVIATPAYADPGPTDEQIATIEGQVLAKQVELAAVNEEYLDAKLELEAQNAAKAEAEAQLAAAQAGLSEAKAQVAAMGAEAYKTGNLPTTVYLLTGDSPAEFIDRANSQQYVDSYHDQKIDQLTVAQDNVQEIKNQADAAQAAAAATEQTLAEKKQVLETELPKLEEEYAKLTAEQQAALDAQRQQNIDDRVAENEASGGGASEAPPTDDETPTPAASGSAKAVVDWAMAQRGKPYVWGGTGPGGFDCSGLTMMAYKQAGVSLPHSSRAQAQRGTAVPMNALQVGDLLYGPGHVGIYIGDGMAVHSPTFGQSVTTITASYFKGARRLL